MTATQLCTAMLPIFRVLPVGGVLLAILILVLALTPPDGSRAAFVIPGRARARRAVGSRSAGRNPAIPHPCRAETRGRSLVGCETGRQRRRRPMDIQNRHSSPPQIWGGADRNRRSISRSVSSENRWV